LTLSDVYAALAYYHDHREEINAEIAGDEAWYEEEKAGRRSLLREKLEAIEGRHASDDPLPPR
jgi:hypothetical protein